MDKKTYSIRISAESREILDENRRRLKADKNEVVGVLFDYQTNSFTKVGEDDNPVVRTSLSKFFHMDYLDNRPQYLKNARQWSLLERTSLTRVILTNAQVADLLKLSIEHDIDPKPMVKQTPSPSVVLSYLMGTFIDAVVQGYLLEMKDE